jgi:ferredoxin
VIGTMDSTTLALVILGLSVLCGLGAFGATSVREGERRAARVAFGASVALSMPMFLATLLPVAGRLAVLGTVGVFLLGSAVLFLLPIGRAEWGDDEPRGRVDERDIMFARIRLEPDSENYRTYYALRPEHQASDDKTRALPGLLSPEASEANPLVFAATEATFQMIDALASSVNGPVGARDTDVPTKDLTSYVKSVTHYWGAHSVGIAALKPYHVYSHVGRGAGVYGQAIHLNHRYGIAYAVEMERDLVRTAPAAPTLLESARQYANAAQIGVQLGNLIRSLGYPARAHIDGNYRVIAPLVARDAGLGEIGRMGLLMTPTLGPRVRLGVVTTDLPLQEDQRTGDPSILDFCALCKKCAEVCPVRAIPFRPRQQHDGVLRWRIKDDVCYRYWAHTGTDCARCMALCPYSYADSTMHNLVRWAVRRSGAARRGVYLLDRAFYGRAPNPSDPPSWIPTPESQRTEERPHLAEGALHGTQ